MKSLNVQRWLATALFALPCGLSAIDSDGDGLEDAVETNTGVYVSPANTGTKPNVADSDGDGAGDWYEVVTIEAPPTSPQPNAPNNPNLKPNIPYPLPAPGNTPPATNKPVKVYIMSGQSNMVGQGNIDPIGTAGTLTTITRNQKKFPNLLNGTGWSVRNDVSYRGVIAATGKAQLTAGQGNSASAIGPELGFGHVMGYYHDEPVLLLKSSQGGRALGWDFLPPGSVSYAVGTTTYAGFGTSPASWTTGTTPTPTAFYAGYQFDQCFRKKTDWAPAGAANAAVFNASDVLDNFAAEYPQYAAQGFQIAGFVWFQGWNDGLSYTKFYADRYEQNMAQFIRQIRTYFEGRYPGRIKTKAPFVLATCAFDAWSTTYPTRVSVANAQLAVGNPARYPEFAGNVKTMEARNYWRDVSVSPVSQNYHYHRNAETFMLVGDALGRGMIDLLGPADTAPPTLASIADNRSGGPLSLNTAVTYTVTFSEDMDASTISAADFGNAGSAAITVGAATATTPRVFTVPVIPASSGTLQLRVNPGAVLKDLAGNALLTTAAIPDDTTLTVSAAMAFAAWAGGTAFTADANRDGVSNGLAWLLGAAGPSVPAVGLLPVPARQAGKLVLTFRCLKTAPREAAVLKVQYTNSPGPGGAPWTSHEAVVPDTDGTVGGVIFDTTPDPDPAFINVRAEIPATAASPDGKLFGRLHASG